MWSQGHAWVKKYALFGVGPAAMLMYRDGAEGAADEAAPVLHLGQQVAAAAAARQPRRRLPRGAERRGEILGFKTLRL